MGLRDIAQVDMLEIIHDTETGGDEITITSPAGVTEDFLAFSQDIAFSIDPETGLSVTGRQCTIAVPISDLLDSGFGSIAGIADESSVPWLVTMTDGNGVEGTFKVAKTEPDNTFGLMVVTLEEYSE